MNNIYEYKELSNTINEIIQSEISETLEGEIYNPSLTKKWCNDISNNIIIALTNEENGGTTNFKFCLTCMVIEKDSSGIHINSMAHYNPLTDGTSTIQWENDNMMCLITLFGLAL